MKSRFFILCVGLVVFCSGGVKPSDALAEGNLYDRICAFYSAVKNAKALGGRSFYTAAICSAAKKCVADEILVGLSRSHLSVEEQNKFVVEMGIENFLWYEENRVKHFRFLSCLYALDKAELSRIVCALDFEAMKAKVPEQFKRLVIFIAGRFEKHSALYQKALPYLA